MKTTIADLNNYRKFELITKAFNDYKKTHQNLVKDLILDATYEGEASINLIFMNTEYKITVTKKELNNEG